MNNILITDEMDLDLNNRFIVFHCDSKFSNKFHILASSSTIESYDNYLYLKEYLKKFYSSDLALEKIIQDSYNFSQKESLFILSEQYNEAIFQEITNDNDLNKYHYAVFYLPNVITSTQKQTILEFKDYFKKFNQIVLCNARVNNSYSIQQVPIAIINKENIDDLERYLPMEMRYIKTIRQ